MDIDKNHHLFSRHSISTIVFQISNYFHSLKRPQKGLFFVFNVSGSFLVLVHIEKMQELILNHREYCSNHFHK